jgi:peptide-N4-(N-acetyl-beta-glucosaminyl)asparagine amidase
MSIDVTTIWKENSQMKALVSIRRSRTLRNTKPATSIKERWPCARDCVGRFIAKIGSQSCWEAVGPARATYQIISPVIKQYLDTYSEPTPTWITWSLYMVGNSPETTIPTIIFCCENESYRKLIRNMVRDSAVLDQYMGVTLKHLPRAPDYNQLVQLASSSEHDKSEGLEEHRDSCLYGPAVFSTSDHPTMGQPLYIKISDQAGYTRKATIGGIIRVHGSYCLLTAAHAFAYAQSEPSAFDHQDEDLYFSDSDSGTISEEDHDSDPSRIPSNDSIYSLDPSRTSTIIVSQTEVDPARLLGAAKTSAQNDIGSKNDQESEAQAFQLPENVTHVGDTLFLSSEGPQEELDYALVRLRGCPTHCSKDEGLLLPDVANFHNLRHLVCGSVVAHTASAGLVSGTISPTPTYLRTPNAKVYQEVYHVNLEKPIANGDCGSWVLDAQSGSLYGHIVAGSPNLGFAYIVPASQTFSDIQRHTGILKERIQRFDSVSIPIPMGYSDSTTFEPTPESKGPRHDNIVDPDKDLVLDDTQTPPAVSQVPFQRSLSNSQDSIIDAEMAQTITSQFRVRLSQLRVQTLRSVKAHTIGPATGTAPMGKDEDLPPAYSAIRNIPLMPVPPTDLRAIRFKSMLLSLSNLPLKWENPGLLDEALQIVPLERVYQEAEEEFAILQAEAESLSSVNRPALKPAWGYQDCVARALLRWFKRDFFTWVNNPQCERCYSPTSSIGAAALLPEEQARGASVVELYQCQHEGCSNLVRFPRYNDAFVLMQTRRGRVGEWATCFGMFCRALGSRVRWVWNAEDLVWLEIFSVHRKRWVHADPCEEAWDKPRLYTDGMRTWLDKILEAHRVAGWGKYLSYCIAFSADGAEDVTLRYVRQTKYSAPRDRCTEAELLHILDSIRATRRDKLSRIDEWRLQGEREKEQRELRGFLIAGLVADLLSLNVVKLPDGSRDIVGKAHSSKMVEETSSASRFEQTSKGTHTKNI